MAVKLNHTIVAASDAAASADLLAGLLGVAAPMRFGRFHCVVLDNGVTLDYLDADGSVETQHYAFLVGEDEFDRIFERIRVRGLAWWADPAKRRPGEVNRRDGGRGLYWDDPDGHCLEILTRPYGSGS